MNSSPAALPNVVEPFPDAELYRVRDKLARQYQPEGDFELMLITQAARSWMRLQQAQAAESRLFAQMDPLTLLDQGVQKFKLITRFVTDSERMWNRALAEIRRAQRARFENAKPGKGPNFQILKPVRRPTPSGDPSACPPERPAEASSEPRPREP